MKQRKEFEGAYESWRRALENAEADHVASLDEVGKTQFELLCLEVSIAAKLGVVDVEVPGLG